MSGINPNNSDNILNEARRILSAKQWESMLEEAEIFADPIRQSFQKDIADIEKLIDQRILNKIEIFVIDIWRELNKDTNYLKMMKQWHQLGEEYSKLTADYPGGGKRTIAKVAGDMKKQGFPVETKDIANMAPEYKNGDEAKLERNCERQEKLRGVLAELVYKKITAKFKTSNSVEVRFLETLIREAVKTKKMKKSDIAFLIYLFNIPGKNPRTLQEVILDARKTTLTTVWTLKSQIEGSFFEHKKSPKFMELYRHALAQIESGSKLEEFRKAVNGVSSPAAEKKIIEQDLNKMIARILRKNRKLKGKIKQLIAMEAQIDALPKVKEKLEKEILKELTALIETSVGQSNTAAAKYLQERFKISKGAAGIIAKKVITSATVAAVKSKVFKTEGKIEIRAKVSLPKVWEIKVPKPFKL